MLFFSSMLGTKSRTLYLLDIHSVTELNLQPGNLTRSKGRLDVVPHAFGGQKSQHLGDRNRQISINSRSAWSI